MQLDVRTAPAGTTGTVLTGGVDRGERFVAFLGAPGEPSGPGWVAADELFGPGLPAALDAAASARGTDSTAVAGSLMLEQYAHRVVAPVLAAWFEEGRAVDARLSAVRIEQVGAGFARVVFTGRVSGTGTGCVGGRSRVTKRSARPVAGHRSWPHAGQIQQDVQRGVVSRTPVSKELPCPRRSSW